jgi:hypothetical protein
VEHPLHGQDLAGLEMGKEKPIDLRVLISTHNVEQNHYNADDFRLLKRELQN